jgi:hypothetical protein
MIDYLKDLWARVQVRWHAVALALIAALPSILNYLEVIDLRPFLTHLGLKETLVDLIVSGLPFALAFIKPMVSVDPVEPE